MKMEEEKILSGRNYSYYLEAALSRVDPDIERIIEFERSRQIRKIILIPSESICPKPVLEALATPLTSLYAEGYPSRRMSEESDEKVLLDFDYQLAHYSQYALLTNPD